MSSTVRNRRHLFGCPQERKTKSKSIQYFNIAFKPICLINFLLQSFKHICSSQSLFQGIPSKTNIRNIQRACLSIVETDIHQLHRSVKSIQYFKKAFKPNYLTKLLLQCFRQIYSSQTLTQNKPSKTNIRNIQSECFSIVGTDIYQLHLFTSNLH